MWRLALATEKKARGLGGSTFQETGPLRKPEFERRDTADYLVRLSEIVNWCEGRVTDTIKLGSAYIS